MAAVVDFMERDGDIESFRNCPPWADPKQYNLGFDAAVDKRMAAYEAEAVQLDAIAENLPSLATLRPEEFVRVENGIAYVDIERVIRVCQERGLDGTTARQIASAMLKNLQAMAKKNGIRIIKRTDTN